MCRFVVLSHLINVIIIIKQNRNCGRGRRGFSEWVLSCCKCVLRYVLWQSHFRSTPSWIRGNSLAVWLFVLGHATAAVAPQLPREVQRIGGLHVCPQMRILLVDVMQIHTWIDRYIEMIGVEVMVCYAYKESLRGRTVTVCSSCSWWQIELLILLQGEFDKIEWIFHLHRTSHKDVSGYWRPVIQRREVQQWKSRPGFPWFLCQCWTGTAANAILVPGAFICLWEPIRVLGRMCKKEEYGVEFESDSNPSVVHWHWHGRGSWVNTNKKLGILLLNLLFFPPRYICLSNRFAII